MSRRQPTFAEPDRLKLLVQSVLSDNLVQKRYRTDWNVRGTAKRTPRFEGHCYAATEAYWHLRGAESSGLIPHQLTIQDDNEGSFSHRWLEDSAGRIIDLTVAPGEESKMKRYPYHDGRSRKFMKSKGSVSARAQEILDRVERARRMRST